MPYRSPGAPKGAKSFLKGKPIRYYRPKGSAAVRTLIDEGFQAFNAARLGEACRIFSDKMLARQHDTTIALTVAGALTPAGLGGCIIEMMQRGLIDFVISTGANLYHDLHYALNFTLHRGSPFLDDRVLYEQGVIRIYDVLFPAKVLLETDSYIRDFLVRSGMNGPVSTAELHYALGRDLIERYPGCQEYSFVAAAAATGVPIYTSSPGDSSIGMNVAYHELMHGGTVMIDPNKDVNEVCAIILAGEKNGCVILGGGSPKNFYLQGQRGDLGQRAFSVDKMLDERPDFVVFNGSVGALSGNNALRAKVGETVRIFFGVGGPNLTSSFHVIGEIFDRVYPSGASEVQTNVQTTLVPAGGATIVEFKVDVPGRYLLVDHSLGRLEKGGAAELIVEGPDNPGVFKAPPSTVAETSGR